jgi:hypothetical protein
MEETKKLPSAQPFGAMCTFHIPRFSSDGQEKRGGRSRRVVGQFAI